MASHATNGTDGDTVHGAERAIADAMGRLREALVTQEQASLPFDRAYVTASNPNKTLVRIHAATFDFYSQVRAYESEIKKQSQRTVRIGSLPTPEQHANDNDKDHIETNLWVQRIYMADVPEERSLEAPSGSGGPLADYYQTMERHHPQLSTSWDISGVEDVDFEEQPISLMNLPKWQGWTRQFDIKRSLPGMGTQVDSRRLRMVIPIAGAWRVYWQLAQALNEIGLLADVEEHLERWGYTTVTEDDTNE